MTAAVWYVTIVVAFFLGASFARGTHRCPIQVPPAEPRIEAIADATREPRQPACTCSDWPAHPYAPCAAHGLAWWLSRLNTEVMQ
jgi:hypothetical protein